MHTQEDRYFIRVMRHAKRIMESVAYRSLKVEPGNIVLTAARSSKNRAHAGIVTEWPKIIHACSPCVEEVDITQDPLWAYKTVEIFDPLDPPQELEAT